MDTPKIPLRSSAAWEYDADADVLYVSVGEPRPAVGVDIGNGFILGHGEARREVTGLTVIGPRERLLRGIAGPD